MRKRERKSNELRPVRIIPDFEETPSHITFVSFGNTKVLTSVTMENSVPPHLKGTGTGWLTAEYSILPYATVPRNRRERQKISGRTREIERLIGRTLRAVVDLPALGEKTVFVDCDVLQADGGTRCASITGAFVSLYLFFKRLQRERKIFAFPVKNYLAAVSCGIVEGEILLDLDYDEDFMATCDMNVVGNGENFAEIQASGEEKTFGMREFQELLKVSSNGLRDLIKFQKDAVEKMKD
ncbi:MAG: ribonuclease PH [Elusimicrobia bacterium]|nr:ribonuclease PH [Elusimicrobiota bacterium]